MEPVEHRQSDPIARVALALPQRLAQVGRNALNRWAVRCAAPDCHGVGSTSWRVVADYSGVRYGNLWYHEPACLRIGLAAQLSRMLSLSGRERPHAHRLPLGLLLVNGGAASPEDLKHALRLQKEAGREKIGYWLRQYGNLDEHQLAAALGRQWGCPFYKISNTSVFTPPQTTIPPAILVAAKGVPVYCSPDRKQIHIAFAERIDHTLLYGVEAVLGCKTIACVAVESVIEEALDKLQRLSSSQDICFDSPCDATEMAGTICSYALQMDARRVQTVRAGAYLWVAFRRKEARRDLLFRIVDNGAPLVRERIKTGFNASEAADHGAEGGLSQA